MKVLEVGRNHPEWHRTFECEQCGSTLYVSQSDLYTRSFVCGAENQVAGYLSLVLFVG